MDAYVLPALAVTMVGFIIYVAVAWLRDGDQRALREFERDDEPGSPQ